MAACTACAKDSGSASPFPAIAKAVPWSGEVRTTDKPAVKLTPCPKDRVLNEFLRKDIFGINMQKLRMKDGEHLFIYN